MNKHKRLILFMIIFCIFIFTCIIFRIFILENILKPLSFLLLMTLYYFVFSINQSFLWSLLIFVGIMIFIYQNDTPIVLNQNNEFGSINFYTQNFERWKYILSVKSKDHYYKNNLKQELTKTMVNIYASKKRLHVTYILYGAFKNKEIQIPENIYSFLFTKDVKIPFFTFRKLFYKISGREALEYKQKIEECLLFMENFMEISDEH